MKRLAATIQPRPYSLALLGALAWLAIGEYAQAQSPVVQFPVSTFTVTASANMVWLPVSMTGTTTLPVSVGFTTSNGTAIAPINYIATTGQVTINAITVGMFMVPLVPNSVLTGTKSFTVTLSSPVNATLGAATTMTVTIVGNTLPPPPPPMLPTVQFVLTANWATESTGMASIAVSLSAASTLPVSVHFDTSNGTAVAGIKYTATTGTLLFAPGIVSRTISVPLIRDYTAGPNTTFNLVLNNPIINATLGTQSTATVTIMDDDPAPPPVGIDHLEYFQPGTGFVPVTGPLHVLVGKSVAFRAIPSPAGVTFPASQPTWSGSSGAIGIGTMVSVNFSVLSASAISPLTVTASCGTSLVTVNVVVFDLLPLLNPQDNFAGRDLTAWGVCEKIDLSYQTLPVGITEYDIGGLQWQITSGGGNLSGGAGGVGVYKCPDVASSIVLSLVVMAGPMMAQAKNAPPKIIVPPDGATVLQRPNTDIWHETNTCSVGFCGDYYATCVKAVSFMEIEVREGTCVSTATGFLKDTGADGINHTASPQWYELKALVPGKGYQWNQDAYKRKYDKIMSGNGPGPYGGGTFNWPIPNEYKEIGTADATAKKYATANQDAITFVTGFCLIRKAGSGDFSRVPVNVTVVPANWND